MPLVNRLWNRGEETSPLYQINSDSVFRPKKRSYPRIIVNIATPILLGLSGAALYQWGNDKRVLTASYLSIGALAQLFIQANFPEEWSEYTQSATSKSSFEIFEILLNALLNVSDPTGQAALLNAIATWGGFSLLGDWFFLFKLKTKDRIGHTLAELDLKTKTVNPILGPSFEDNKGQILLKTSLTALGVGLAVFSYFKETGFNVFYRSVGFFLITQGLGFFLAREFAERWKKNEIKDLTVTDGKSSIRRMSPQGENKDESQKSDLTESDPETTDVQTHPIAESPSEDETPSPRSETDADHTGFTSDEEIPTQDLDTVEEESSGSEQISEQPPKGRLPFPHSAQMPRRMASSPSGLSFVTPHTQPPSPLSARVRMISEEGEPEDDTVYPDLDFKDLNRAAGASSIQSPISFKTKLFRGVAKVITGIGLEALTILCVTQKSPYSYLAAGILYGGIQYFAQRKFQVMTQQIYQLQQNKNITQGNVNTAVKVERAASVAFLFMFLGWFGGWGIYDSLPKERVGVIVLVISYLLTGASAIPVERYFKPEQKGKVYRILNHLRYALYHNPYAIALAYFSLTQITEANDRALQSDNLSKYICALVALALFGSYFAVNRMRSVSLSGFTTTASPLMRILLIKTLFERATNQFGV